MVRAKSASAWRTRETLLERVRDPEDEQSWEDFVRYYRPFVYQIARRMNIAHHDAEEIVQNVMVKAWNKLPEFEYDRGRGRFRGWLCQVTGNAVRDFIRHCRRSVALADQEFDPEHSLAGVDHPAVEKIAEQEWRRYLSDLAWKNIEKKFKPHVARVFLMAVKGVPTLRIMEELGIAESSVYVYKSRVQKKLRAEIIRLNRLLG